MQADARQVLMAGGPAHGRWVTVEGRVQSWRAVVPQKIDFRAPVEVETPLRTVEYRIMPLMLLGHQMWVGVAIDEAYDDRAVMKAVLQRDVAAHLGAYR